MEIWLHKSYFFCIVSAFVFISVYHGTEMQAEAGIKCWVCNSFNDLGCGDPFDNSSFPITDCDAELNKRANLQGVKATMCRKLVQKIEGKWRFIRGCAFLGEPGIGGDERFCRRYLGSYDLYTEDCLCRSKDGCNGAISTKHSLTEFTIIVSSLTLFSLSFIIKKI
ncbi:uncharacterized protein LOC110848860 [Folsomia candida]|uniref:uncharacterized protein LOC110848860 n=1 Tax=Folsomia candida TaxID=158441 RepID=UPI000B8F1084|nr:uncharacterized protein LOC110848860 [Folsomia candida]